jgi:hypothetical protein
MDLKEIENVDPDVHWYYQSKLAAIKIAISKQNGDTISIIDVGAGSGFFSRALVDSAGRAICVDPNYEAEFNLDNQAVTFRRSVESNDCAQAKVFLFMDVLEHVEDDLALLRSYLDFATPGALVVVTVPAFKSLWSAHDEYLEHKRRYRLREIATVAECAGLELVTEKYLFGSIFPLVWLVRNLRKNTSPSSDMKETSKTVNFLLSGLLKFENKYVPNRVFGLTAMVVARVPIR